MIICCEPQCYGFEHAEVNASMLHASLTAFPHEKFVFMAEPDHLAKVSEALVDGMRRRVEFIEIQIAPRRSSNIKRFFKEYRVYRAALDFASGEGTKKILFLSITSPGLVWLKWLMLFHPGIRAAAVMHGILETIDDRAAILKYEFFFWLRFTLLTGNYDRIKYILFGSFVKKVLDQRYPSLERFTRSMDLPYKFEPVSIREPFENHVIRFGALGVGSRSKGTDVFFNIARTVGSEDTAYKPKFFLVGPVTDDTLNVPPAVDVLSKDGSPLTGAGYRDGSMALDYAVFCHRPSHYKYSTSAAFFDALAYGKPVIALRNPLFEYYFELLGEIGYLCNSEAEMLHVISKILALPSAEEYKKQRSKILDGRRKLGIAHSADQIKEIW